MFSPAGRSDVTQTVMSAFSIKRTLELNVLNVRFGSKADIRGTHEVVIWRLLIYLMNLKCARFGASL